MGWGWVWVDAHDPDGDGVYIQSRTGLALPFENWKAGEPNNLSVEKCGYLATEYLSWNNVRCGDDVPIVCEYDIVWKMGYIRNASHDITLQN